MDMKMYDSTKISNTLCISSILKTCIKRINIAIADIFGNIAIIKVTKLLEP